MPGLGLGLLGWVRLSGLRGLGRLGGLGGLGRLGRLGWLGRLGGLGRLGVGTPSLGIGICPVYQTSDKLEGEKQREKIKD